MRVFYGAIFGLGSGFFQIGQKFSKMITNWGLNWSCSIMAEIAQREIGVWSAKQGRANELDNPPSSSWTLKLISNFSAATALPSSNDCKKNQDVIVIALTKEIPNLFDILNCSCIFFCWQISFFAITWLPFKTFTNCCQAHEKLSLSFLQQSIAVIKDTRSSLQNTLSKHRKNCEGCPGHYLIVNHFSSMSWFKFCKSIVSLSHLFTKSLSI